MTKDFIIELVGRYIFTGAILWGAAFLLMTIRMIYKISKAADFQRALRIVEDNTEKSKAKKASQIRLFLRIAIWPYGILKVIHLYMEEEMKLVKKFNEM